MELLETWKNNKPNPFFVFYLTDGRHQDLQKLEMMF